MPKLGEFIGALLSDAVQARVRADLEAIKIAESYSAHELLKHLPVPRFRLPDITVDFPVLVSSVEGTTAKADERPFEKPTRDEVRNTVRRALTRADVRIRGNAADIVSEAVAERAEHLFKTGPQFLLSPARVSADLASTASEATRVALKDKPLAGGKLQELELAAKSSLQALLLTKLSQSPHLQVIINSGDIKSHGDQGSIVRVRVTITEDAYEVINRDEGGGFTLTPE
jgi:hypothetical protein